MPSRQVREESWNSLHHSEASGENNDNLLSDVSMGEGSESSNEGSDHQSPNYPTLGDVQRALHPLQATADRVGKQVERFAENLDRLTIKRKQDARKDCTKVMPLVNAYQKIASDTVRHLEVMHAPERGQQLPKHTRRKNQTSIGRSNSGQKSTGHSEANDMMTTVEDLRFWEQEKQTWGLLKLMLQVEYPAPGELPTKDGKDTYFVRPNNEKSLHYYSPEKDLWENFLATDDQAWERVTVLNWLQTTADTSRQDIDQVVEELESSADRSSGLWAHSWLYSKEAIKGQKRLRSWPKALEPNSPGLDTSLRNAEKTQALVTQLDPDAITRQSRTLEKQDKLFERAVWLACWEMVRRGKDWDYVRDWCEQRVEYWRATVIYGDPRSALSQASPTADWRSRALWRKACALAARDGGIDEYEKAVYGVLSGYLPSVLKVSRSWDDYLFAHYNSYLLQSFERHLRVNFPARMPEALTDQHSSFTFSTFGGQRVQSGNQLVEKLKLLDATKEEAQTPIKMLQGSLVAKTFDDFVYRHGARLARSANAIEKSKILTPMSDTILEGTITAELTMADHDLLRLITHIILVCQDIGYDFGEGDRRQATDNIIVAYVDYLGRAGKQQLLPLYASRLAPERSVPCLGRQLPFVLDREERQTFMRLMAQEDIDVPAVLSTDLIMIIDDSPQAESKNLAYPKLRILEQTREDAWTPRQIRNDFIGDTMTDDQQDLIHGFEWYLLLEGHWKQTMMVGTIVYKHLLRSHALAAARIMSGKVSFSKISLNKTKAILDLSMDIGKEQEIYDGDEEEDHDSMSEDASRFTRVQHHRNDSSLRRLNNDRKMMLDQARSLRDFERLFGILDALDVWKSLANEGKQYSDLRHGAKTWKEAFQDAYSKVEISIKPLLQGWLQDPSSDSEAMEFKQIRVNCLPEVVLAYISVLDYSSRFLSRDLLLKGMDLAALIAEEDSDLASCFMAAKRMSELVDAFASLSKTMIQADGVGAKGGKGKRKKNGETLSLWSVRTASP